MQTVRQVVHVFGNLLRSRPCVGSETLRLTGILAYLVEIHCQQRQRLADVVVEFACDPRALGLLCVEQSRSEVTDSLVARPKITLASAQLAPLIEQCGNQP